MEPLHFVLDLLADWLGDDPSTPRWEIITAIFGWAACVALLGWLVTSLVGFPQSAGYLIAAFWIVFGIAFRRDLTKLWHRRRKGGKS
jgi:hypothetical protein